MDGVTFDPQVPSKGTPTYLLADFPYKRVLIYGVTGSGKTTMAANLSSLTGLTWTEVDTLTWEPNWVEVPKEVQIERIREICSRDEWILDSAYGKWIDIPLERVELIIGLDYSRWRSLRQLIWRTTSRAWSKELVCNGNVESFRGMFSRTGLIMWHFQSFGRKRERIHNWANEGKVEVVVLKHPRELDELLLSWGLGILPEFKTEG